MRFLSALTTFCNPVTLQVCTGEPDFFFNALIIHLVVDSLIYSLNCLMDDKDMAFVFLRDTALVHDFDKVIGPSKVKSADKIRERSRSAKHKKI